MTVWNIENLSSQTPSLLDQEFINNDPIFNIFTAIRSTQALQVAHEIKLFPLLSAEPLTLMEIAKKLNMRERAAQALLSMCTSLELLSITAGKYHLTAISRHYLLPESPYYSGTIIDMALHTPEVGSYEAFKKALFSNSAQAYGEDDLFEINEVDAIRAEIFTRAMHSKSMTAASLWPRVIDLSHHRRLLDIGGGSGAHAINVVKIWPSLSATIYERPLVGRIALEFIEDAGLQNQIQVQVGNMWKDEFPKADLHFYSDIFHDWPLEKAKFLIQKSFKSLPSQGRILIHELLFNDQKSGPLSTAAYNIIMLLWTQGQQFSRREFMTLLEEAGFINIKITRTGFGDWNLIEATKP